jgi:polyisoprenoid-binding protein YceI
MRMRTDVWRRATAFTLGAALILVAAAAHAASLKIDPEHSTIGFRVRHLISTVNGRFNEFSGSIEYDAENLSLSSVKVTIQAASVDTNVAARDKDLRSKRFFDVEKHPTLDFESDSITDVSGSKGKIKGRLTIHGVTKPVVLDAEFLGQSKDPWGNEHFGFQARTTISREEFGMKWNEVIEAGGVMVGDEVEIILDISAVPAG